MTAPTETAAPERAPQEDLKSARMGRWVVALAVLTVAFGTWAIYQAATPDASTEPPAAVSALIDDWYAANSRADGSVLDLYVAEGYHLYGDQRYEFDAIPGHLSYGGATIEHEWLTEPILIAEDEDGRYVVVRGLRNTSAAWSNASAMMFEIVTTAEGELRFVQTAWFYDTEW